MLRDEIQGELVEARKVLRAMISQHQRRVEERPHRPDEEGWRWLMSRESSDIRQQALEVTVLREMLAALNER